MSVERYTPGWNKAPLSGRRLKAAISTWLKDGDIHGITKLLADHPARLTINSLISCFCSSNPVSAWMARVAAGRITARLSETDMESARVIMRRFMWMLNDESGGIGWGVPEAMAEAIACSRLLADEYASIFSSYAFMDQNYLEFPALQRGLLWGIGRVAEVSPGLVSETGDIVIGFMSSPDPVHRGYAAWAAGNLGIGREALEKLVNDKARVMIFINEHLTEKPVSELAAIALKKAGF